MLLKSEAAYQLLFDKAPFTIGIATPDGRILAVNKATEDIFGYTSDELKAINVRELYVRPHDRNAVLRILKESGRVRDYEVALKRKNGEVIHVLLNIDMLKLDGQDILFVTERNITEFKRIKQRLLENDDNLTALLKTAQETLLIVKTDGTILAANEIAAARVGKCANELPGLSMYCLLPPSVAANRKARLEHAVSSCRAVYFEDERDGRYLANTYYPVADDGGNVVRVVIIAQDITERKRIEDNLRLHSEVLSSMSEGFVITNTDGAITYTNRKFEEMFGYGRNELIGRPASLLNAPTDKNATEIAHEIKEAMEKTGGWKGEILNMKKDGTTFWCQASVSAFESPWSGKVWIGVHEDITERKRIEERIVDSFKEKEVLLREIHHRVKNNLQIISSLLNLQARTLPDGEFKTVFKKSRDRIESMALIHDKLYHSENLAKLNIAGYIRDLIDNLFSSYEANPARIKKKTDIDDILLSIDTAVPLGLIITELATNCLKHAFPSGTEGEIMLGFHQAHDNTYTLTVSDTGTGLPEGLDFRSPETLGLRLIHLLVRQLKGTVEIDRKHGTQFIITFLSGK